MPARLAAAVLLGLVGLSLPLLAAEDEMPKESTSQEALRPMQELIGAWQGVAQPRRGSNRGAWRESGQWSWNFSNCGPALVFEAPGGRIVTAATIRPAQDEIDTSAERPAPWRMEVTGPDGTTAELTGRQTERGDLEFVAEEPSDGLPERIVLRLVASGDRLVVLYEARQGTGRLTRLAEVGYTRQGSGFGQGRAYPECIVTGGRATIAVEYQGQTHYVCCGGCKDLFLADPQGILDQYRAERNRPPAEEDFPSCAETDPAN